MRRTVKREGHQPATLRSRFSRLRVVVCLADERNSAQLGEDLMRLLERVPSGFSVTQGDEAAAQAQEGLALLQPQSFQRGATSS
jgi:hypothetical protein